MSTVTVAKAKAQLSDILHRVESGEEVIITRRGKPVARLAAVAKRLKSPPSLAEFRATLPAMKDSSAKVLRKMRDEGY